LLAEFRDDPRAADAMVNAMNKVEEKTNTLQMALVQNLNKCLSCSLGQRDTV